MLEPRLLLSTLYDLDVIAHSGAASTTTSGDHIDEIEQHTSINDAGVVAFVGTLSGPFGSGMAVLVGDSSAPPQKISFSALNSRRSYSFPQINDHNKVVAAEVYVDPAPPMMLFTLIRVWDASNPGVWKIVGANYDPPPVPLAGYDAVTLPTMADGGGVSFVGLLEGVPDDVALLVNATGQRYQEELAAVVPFDAYRPMISDVDTVALRADRGGGQAIWLLGVGTASMIAGPASGFASVGRSPGIAEDGRVVSFSGEDADGPGVFVSIDSGSGPVVRRVAGVSGNGVLDPGEAWDDANGNDQVDPGEDLGSLGGFDPDSRVGVSRLGPANPGQITVVYLGTDPGGTAGLYVSRVDCPNLDPPTVSAPQPVIEVGDPVEGLGTVSSISLYDPVNSAGQIAFQVTIESGIRAVVRATPMAAGGPTDEEFEILARDVAYDESVDLGSTIAFEDYRYTVTEVFDDPTTGFHAMGLTSADLDPILLIRGTQLTQINDVLADFDTRGVGFGQFEANRDAVEAWLDSVSASGATPHIVGHSLGGAVAQLIAAEYTSRNNALGRIVTFNSPGISKDYADLFRTDLASATHYVVSGDLVSMAGERFIEGSCALASYWDWSLLGKHLRPVLAGSAGGWSRPGDTRFTHYDSVSWLNHPFFFYRDLNYFAWLDAAEATALVIPALQPFADIPPALLFRSTTEALRGRIGQHWDDIVGLGMVDPTQVDPTTAEVFLPDLSISLRGILDVRAEELSMRYTQEPAASYRIQGRVHLSGMFDAAADFAGDNYIAIREDVDDPWDVVGGMSVARVAIVPGVWEVRSAELFLDTTEGKLRGDARVLIPGNIEVNGGLGFHGGQLDYVSLGVDGLNIAIASTGAFLQRIQGTVDHIADLQPIDFGGGLGITAGPEVSVSLPTWAGGDFSGALIGLDVAGALDADRISASGTITILGGLATGTGQAELRWRPPSLRAESTFDFLGGMITATGALSATPEMDITMFSEAAVSLPAGPFPLNGQALASGKGYFQFRNDASRTNDYVTAYGTLDLGSLGEITLGFQVDFAGNTKVIRSLSDLPEQADGPAGGAPESHWPASAGSARQGFVVGPSTHLLLLTALWDKDVGPVAVQVEAPDGTLYREADMVAMDTMGVVPELSGPTWRTVGVLDAAEGVWTIILPDTTGVGSTTFRGQGDAEAPTIELTTLSRDGMQVTIGYNAWDGDSEARVSLYYDTDAEGHDGILIVEGLPETGGHGSFAWDTSIAPPGSYYLYAIIDDGGSALASDYSDTPIEVTHPGARVALDTYPGDVLPKGTEALAMTFTEPVRELSEADVVLSEDSLGAVVPEYVALSPDGTSATLVFEGRLPVRDRCDTYTFIVRDSVLDLSGRPLDGDGDGQPGGDYVTTFSVAIVGDANIDGKVGIADLSALADNYGQPGAWADGDFDGNGVVGIADLSALADNYGEIVNGGSIDAAAAADAAGSALRGLASEVAGLLAADEDAALEASAAAPAPAALPVVVTADLDVPMAGREAPRVAADEFVNMTVTGTEEATRDPAELTDYADLLPGLAALPAQ